MYQITLDGPSKNALSTDMMTTLLAEIDLAKGAPILITGTGNVFCAGLDLKEIISLDEAAMQSYLYLLERLMATLFIYLAPTAAAINGHVIAGGCVLAQCCDHRVALERADLKIGLNEVALGVQYPPRVFEIVRQRIPNRHLQTVILEAGLYNPMRARELGLLDRVSSVPFLEAEMWLKGVSAHPASSFAAAKAQLRGRLEVSETAYAEFFERALPSWTSEELKSKVHKMLSPRKKPRP